MRITLMFLGVLLLANVALADCYLLINKVSKEVQDFSPWNDAVVQEGQEKIVLPGKIADYGLIYGVQDYKYNNGKFVVNSKKISDRELAIEENAEINAEADLIKAKIADMAVAELKKGGQTFKHEADAKERAK